MGGFILCVADETLALTTLTRSGYDTGQISDILIMEDFLQRFGESDGQGGYSFSHVREGLIVAMLSIGTLIGEPSSRVMSLKTAS